MVDKKEKLTKITIHAIKIAIGSCVAILIAEWLSLEFASSAGIIALLSTVKTKWATVKLAVIRLFSFILMLVLSFVIFEYIRSDWVAYGIFMFFLFTISSLLDWKDTISVNAVAGTHFLLMQNFSLELIINEFLLVITGVSVALVVNLFNNYKGQRARLIHDMKYAEEKLQAILEKTVEYLLHEEVGDAVWEDLKELEKNLSDAVERAYEYHENTFRSHPDYYIKYLKMRTKQCDTLGNLHYELMKVRHVPQQAQIVANFILYMRKFVKEHNIPEKQLVELHKIFDAMKKDPLPTTRSEFESRAMLHHVLMDLEDFLMYKKHFIASLDEKQKEIYWKEV